MAYQAKKRMRKNLVSSNLVSITFKSLSNFWYSYLHIPYTHPVYTSRRTSGSYAALKNNTESEDRTSDAQPKTGYHHIPYSVSSYLIYSVSSYTILRIIISHTPYHHIIYSVSLYTCLLYTLTLPTSDLV